MADTCGNCGLDNIEHGVEVCLHHLDATVQHLHAQLSAATARAEAAEAENAAWRMLVNWTHRGVDRGLDAYDDDVLIVASDKVVFIGKSALECVKGIPALASRWIREDSPPKKKPTDEGGRVLPEKSTR